MRFILPSHLEQVRFNIIIPVAAGYILGALLAGFLPPGDALLRYVAIAAGIGITVLLIFHRHPAAVIFTIPLFFLLGFIHTGHALHPPADRENIYNLVVGKTRGTITGTVVSMPEFDGHATRICMEIDSLRIQQKDAPLNEPSPAHGRILLSIDGPIPNTIKPGDHLLAIVKLNRIANYRTPGVFNYRLYQASRSVYITGRANSPQAIMPFVELGEPWYRKLHFYPERVRHSVRTFLEARLKPGMAGLYAALLIGSRTGIDSAVLENFKATGCMHLLAISGLHMGLLGMISFVILSWIMKRSTFLLHHVHVPTIATFLSLPLLFAYAFIAGMNTPVMRALIMAVFFLLGVVLHRQRSILHIVAAAALFLLLVRPLAVFTASFQLSFSSVLAIALIFPRLIRLLDKESPTIPARIYAYLSAAFLVSIAATLGSLPFMLLHFNRFSPIGPFMNLLVEPLLCFWALPLGLTALPFTFLSPETADFILKIGSYGFSAAIQVTALGSSIPFASLWSITPSFTETMLYYAILALWFFAAGPTQKRVALVLSALFIFYFTRGLWYSLPGRTTEISYLDIGQGSSTFIKMPEGRTVLLDGGNTSSPPFDPGERIIAPFLWKNKIWRLEDVIISHPHSDHYNGLKFIVSHFHPKRLWINGRENDTRPYSELLQEAESRGVQIIAPEQADLVLSDRKASLTGIHNYAFNREAAHKGEEMPVNDLSLVLRLQHDRHSFLFPGDIGVHMEEFLVEQETDLQADVLLAPHHGSSGSGSKTFLDSVDPEFIVVSAGRNSKGRYPSAQHLREWRADGRTILEISRVGTVTFTTDGTRMQAMTYNRAPAGPEGNEPEIIRLR